MLEIGVPFSDPTADGPVIAAAAYRAIQNGGSLRAAQRALLRYPAPMEMHAMTAAAVAQVVRAGGGRLLAADPVAMYGGHWRYERHFAVRDTAVGDAAVRS